MKLSIIYKCENCGETFEGGYMCNIKDPMTSPGIERCVKDVRIHHCKHEVWGIAHILRLEKTKED